MAAVTAAVDTTVAAMAVATVAATAAVAAATTVAATAAVATTTAMLLLGTDTPANNKTQTRGILGVNQGTSS